MNPSTWTPPWLVKTAAKSAEIEASRKSSVNTSAVFRPEIGLHVFNLRIIPEKFNPGPWMRSCRLNLKIFLPTWPTFFLFADVVDGWRPKSELSQSFIRQRLNRTNKAKWLVKEKNPIDSKSTIVGWWKKEKKKISRQALERHGSHRDLPVDGARRIIMPSGSQYN